MGEGGSENDISKDSRVFEGEPDRPVAPDGHRYRIADAHAHIYPEKISEKATRAVGQFYGVEMAVTSGKSEVLLENGSKIGCEKYLVCSVATKIEQVDSISRFIAGECAIHPEFIGLGAYHQDETDPVAALDRVQELGLLGVKVHPDFQKFNIDDPCMMPLYRELVARNMLILFHMGDDRYDFSAPRRLAHVLEEVPDLKCIAAHFGGYRQWSEAADVLGGENVYFDTSSSLWCLDASEAAFMAHHYGIEKMLFGVDFPMWNHSRELGRFFKMGLSYEENKAVLYDNFARLFGIVDAVAKAGERAGAPAPGCGGQAR